MRIRIHILPRLGSSSEPITYTVTSAEQCRDQTDRSAYEAACLTGSTVSMGCVIAEVL